VAGRVVIYCPDLPPVPGGLPDHTLALARALAARGVDVAVLGRRGEPERFAPIPCRVGVEVRGLLGAVARARATGLVLQFVPFQFARLGVSPDLVRVARRVRGAGARLGVLLHEPYVPFTRLPWLVTGIPMRWQFRAVVRSADVIWSAVPAFLARARRVARRTTRLSPAPVGSTVPVVPVPRAEARAALGLGDGDLAIGAFSPAASGSLPPWIGAAAERLADQPQVSWVLFGHGSGEARLDAGGARVLRLGRLEPAEVSRTFQGLDLAVAPFADGLTLRRTSAMTALAHGVALVSSRGHLFDPALETAAACEATPVAFAATVRDLALDAGRRRALGAAGREFYERAGSVEVLAERVAADLEPQ
jgi:hypothetical protein